MRVLSCKRGVQVKHVPSIAVVFSYQAEGNKNTIIFEFVAVFVVKSRKTLREREPIPRYIVWNAKS